MQPDDFRNDLLTHFDQFKRTVTDDAGDWVVKGFIDVYRNVYAISVDIKVISKVIELMLFPVIAHFAAEYGYRMVLCDHQNDYPDISDSQRIYCLDDLQTTASVVKDFTYLLHEKWRIASDRPGGGNTKNIGSTRDTIALVEGRGPFAAHGQQVFDDYWMNYLTEDMARAIDSEVPYRNLRECWEWRHRDR